MLRALYHSLAAAWFRWVLNGMHPAHPDASFVQLRYAYHRSALELFLQGRT